MSKTWRHTPADRDEGFDVVYTPNPKKRKFDLRKDAAGRSRKNKEKFLDEVSADNRFVGIDPRQT